MKHQQSRFSYYRRGTKRFERVCCLQPRYYTKAIYFGQKFVTVAILSLRGKNDLFTLNDVQSDAVDQERITQIGNLFPGELRTPTPVHIDKNVGSGLADSRRQDQVNVPVTVVVDPFPILPLVQDSVPIAVRRSQAEPLVATATLKTITLLDAQVNSPRLDDPVAY